MIEKKFIVLKNIREFFKDLKIFYQQNKPIFNKISRRMYGYQARVLENSNGKFDN